ncbi:dnaJ homolog subfamily C member 9 [Lampris incognitus]|uniref:dnaJ homolog subfamily C member 9 n=1 Tax=Lampris incognitus TaxID=2546036 RepID=UPI0024B5EAB5|nr:dnaJ homolog subfamily C member 9 [Lampris incognitus]
MGLLEECQELFGTTHLYEVIGVDKAASEADIRRGYYKSSLKIHPDRAPEDPQATAKFQTLGRVYAVLNDKDQRAVYDEQGIIEDESDLLKQDCDWEEYWRISFPTITVQDIIDFEKTYKGSEEERADVMRKYTEWKGDMTRIMQTALCVTHADEPRIRDLLQSAIDAGDLPAFKAFTHESARKRIMRQRKADKEREECEQMEKELGLGEQSLTALIKRKNDSRKAGFNSFIDGLEKKYCQKKPAASSRKAKKVK